MQDAVGLRPSGRKVVGVGVPLPVPSFFKKKKDDKKTSNNAFLLLKGWRNFCLNKRFKYMGIKQIIHIWARAVDHEFEKDLTPNLNKAENYVSLIMRTFLILLNTITCLFIIAGICRHWND